MAGARANPHHTAANTSQNYSPLRSKTPPVGVREAKEQDEKQLQNQSISASNISHVSTIADEDDFEFVLARDDERATQSAMPNRRCAKTEERFGGQIVKLRG